MIVRQNEEKFEFDPVYWNLTLALELLIRVHVLCLLNEFLYLSF